MNRFIIHVDMDAFYASIEKKDNPNYRNKPIAVGGSPEGRGVICTACYEARKFGIRAAMPSKLARRLCPHLIFLPVRMERYIEVSHQIHKIFKDYSELIEPISIDEAFLDITGKNPIEIAKAIKKRIYHEIGLTASVGISINKYLAKLASDYDKPDGLTIIEEKDVKYFLSPLPIRKLWGVGPKTEKALNKLGIYRICDLLKYDKNILIEKFGKKGIELLEFAQGKDERPVENGHRRKSIGEEITFEHDVDNLIILKEYVLNYCKILSNRLKKNNLLAKTVTLKIKYEDFKCITRSISLPNYTDNFKEIYGIGEYLLLNKIYMNKKVRLLGVQVSNILYPDEPVQLQMDLNL